MKRASNFPVSLFSLSFSFFPLSLFLSWVFFSKYFLGESPDLSTPVSHMEHYGRLVSEEATLELKIMKTFRTFGASSRTPPASLRSCHWCPILRSPPTMASIFGPSDFNFHQWFGNRIKHCLTSCNIAAHVSSDDRFTADVEECGREIVVEIG